MKFFDFGAFQKIEKMLSHDKILFHMIFGAFHDTSCNKVFMRDNNDCQNGYKSRKTSCVKQFGMDDISKIV